MFFFEKFLEIAAKIGTIVMLVIVFALPVLCK